MLPQMTINLNEKFIIEDLIYIPTGNYMPMYSRPYMVNVTSNAIDKISEKLSESKSGKITPNIINGVASEIIQPNAAGYISMCDNQWVSTKRFIFMLKVSYTDHTGQTFNNYIQGYTEYDGITNTGHINLKLNHYINNVVETAIRVLQTPLGIMVKEKLYRIYNVIFNGKRYNELFTQRPSDILENIKLIDTKNMIGDNTINVQYMGSYMNAIDNKVLSSNVENNITTEYLSNILNYGIQNAKNRDIFVGSYGNTYNSDMSPEAAIPEPDVNDNKFIKYISRMEGYRIVREAFTFETLMKIDPTIYNRFKVYNITKDYVDPLLVKTPEVGDYWHGQDIVTLKAYSLIENSVALAVKYGFNKIFFTASNMTNITTNVEVFIMNFNSFINLDEQDFNFLLEIFKTNFITEIFYNETNNGSIPMHADIYVDLLGTSKIYLSFAGMQANWYTIPTFANSLFSPVVSISKEAVDFTSDNIKNLINQIEHKNTFLGYSC